MEDEAVFVKVVAVEAVVGREEVRARDKDWFESPSLRLEGGTWLYSPGAGI